MKLRHLLFCCTASIAISTSAAVCAVAQPSGGAAGIPADDAVKTIPEFARQHNIQIIAPGADLHGVKTKAIPQGAGLPDGLNTLISGTGLEIASNTGSVVILRRATTQVDQPATDGGAVESVTITGIRGGLRQGISAKREADSVVDAISAEDVAKFPDSNIAESLQRITGVQITRLRGEGQSANIRGLPSIFTLTTLNGRPIPNAMGIGTVTRSFDFTIFPAEFIQTLEVHKSPTASLDEGGLSGTVNVKTPSALAVGRQRLVGSVQLNRESKTGVDTPSVTGFYSDIFADGRLGIALGGSYYKRLAAAHVFNATYTTTTEGAGLPPGTAPVDLNLNGIIEPTARVRTPGVAGYRLYNENNERLSGIGSIEFEPNENLRFYLQGFYSKRDVFAQSNEHFTNYNSSGGFVPQGSAVKLLEGIPTLTTIQVNSADNRGGNRIEDRAGETYSTAAGFSSTIGAWKISAEVGLAGSTQIGSNINLATIVNGPLRYVATADADVGSEIFLNGYDTGILNRANYRLASLNGDFRRHTSDSLYDAKMDVVREFDDSIITAVRVGGKYSDRKLYQDNKQILVGAAGISNLVGGLPPGPVAGSFSPAQFLEIKTAPTGRFLDGYDGPVNFLTQWLGTNTPQFLSQYSDQRIIAAGELTNQITGIINVKEQSLAGYVMADFAWGPITGNIGTRIVETSQQSVGASPDLNGIQLFFDAGGVTRVPSAVPVTVDRSYMDILPSLNVKYQISDEWIARFSASRTMTRPNLADLSPTVIVNGNALSIVQSNPLLDPYRSNNVDVTLEWYFDDDGLVGTSLFTKSLESLVRRVSTIRTLPVTFVRDSGQNTVANRDFTSDTLINGTGVDVKGVEIYYQQAFRDLPAPFDGLGTILNYTFIDNSDPTLLTAASKHNANGVLYYEKGQVGMRMSYSWRSGFLSSPSQGVNFGVVEQPFGSLDGDFSYRFNDNVSVVLQGSNLLNTPRVQRFTSDLPALFEDNGRRLVLGVRASL